MSEVATRKRESTGAEGDPEDGPGDSKRPKIEETDEPKDPGKKT